MMLWMMVASVSLMASSHREAPLISNDPLADNVDLYAFRSPDNPDMITLIATYVPMQLPQGGPNYYSFGENIRYEIHVDNDATIPGDEVTYRFTFTQVNEDPTTFFNIRLGAQNLKTTYTLQRSLDGGTTWQTIITDGVVPPNNIGTRSIESAVGLNTTYKTLFEGAITDASTGEKVFAGPTDDPFFVDLGGIFDLGDAPRQNGTPVDGLACYNVSAIAIQVPISTLLKADAPATPTNILDSDYVIGVWASASRPAITTLSADANPEYSGDWVQVSRLGMPLTNEAVIAIGDKDYWNSITPYDEITETTMDGYFYNPELALYMDDDLFGGAVPAFGPLRIQKSSLGAFDFSNGADGLYGLKGSDAVEGTALDDDIFGTLLLPGPGQPRSVDLWPAFHTGVPNFPPYQLATGKGGNPLAEGKPFVNNFLPNGGDMLRLNMAVPPTPRDDANFSSLGLIQAAAIGLTVAPFNETAELEFIPNMDGFPNGRRLEDDVTRIELQAVAGVVLAAVGLWYDDFDPENSPSPVTQDLVDVLTYTTGVEKNDRPFSGSFPYLAMPFSGTGNCSGEVIPLAGEDQEVASQIFVSSNTTGQIGVYEILENNELIMSSFLAQGTDADGIHYDQENDVLYQLNRSDNVINAYSNVAQSIAQGMPLELTATSTSDFSNGREIAVAGNKLVVAQDANSANNNQNRLIVYDVSATAISLSATYDVDFNLWGIVINEGALFAIQDNTNKLAVFSNFFLQPEGVIPPTNVIEIEGIVRTHGIAYVPAGDRMLLTDVGAASSPDDGAVTMVWDFSEASMDGIITLDEQSRIEGPSTFLGNPVDIAWEETTMTAFVAERANGGGRVLGFQFEEGVSGDIAPTYNESFGGASAVFTSAIPQPVVVDQIFMSSNNTGNIGLYELLDDNSLMTSTFASQGTDADGIYYDQANDVLYQLNRSDNVVNAYSNVAQSIAAGTPLQLTATSTSDFSNGREITLAGSKLIVAQDANAGNGNQNRLLVYDASATSITLDKTYDLGINLWGIVYEGSTLFAIEDNADRLAVFEYFLTETPGMIAPTQLIEIENMVRTHGINYISSSDKMLLTDVGAASSPDDGAVIVVDNFMAASADDYISADEQLRVEGPSTFLGNPVDIAYSESTATVFVAERANGGGRLLGFPESASGDVAPSYNELFGGASAIFINGQNADELTGADVALEVSVDNLLYAQYTEVAYSITVTNNGPEATTNVSVAAGLPEGVVYTSDSPSKGDYELFFERWDVGALESGESATLELVLFPLVGGVDITNYFQVLTSTTDDPDSTPGNDTDMTVDEDDEAAITITPVEDGGDGGGDGESDLELSVTTDAPAYAQWTFVTYTFSLTNNGPDATSDIIVDIPQPAALAYTSDAATIGNFNLFFEEWTIDNLESGETAELTLVLFNKVIDQTVDLYAEVRTSFQPDPDSTPGNGDGMNANEDDEAVVSFEATNVGNMGFQSGIIFSAVPNANGVALYPNPVSNELNVEFVLETEKANELFIYDVNGRQRSVTNFNPSIGFNKVSIATQDLPAGIYFLQIPTADGTMIVNRFVKKNL